MTTLHESLDTLRAHGEQCLCRDCCDAASVVYRTFNPALAKELDDTKQRLAAAAGPYQRLRAAIAELEREWRREAEDDRTSQRNPRNSAADVSHYEDMARRAELIADDLASLNNPS